ncbi:MAG: hypothetical protein M2R45_05219 [Verrucomicrobia subdivision 3 bacterium]|nr:hypothetical protein [Limisphaerales bacterium]MCS1417453.1 hypothetical protein [Limisphaerales bacterium]
MHRMISNSLALAAAFLVISAAQAGPLDQLKVSSDAKWLVHLDLESFRNTQIGAYINDTLLASHREKIREEFKRELGFDLDWNGIKSFTAFGSEYNDHPETARVMLIRTAPELQTEFHNLLESKVDAGFGPLKIQPIKSKLEHLYSLAGELYIAVEPQGLFLLGKSRKQVESARLTLKGSTPVTQAEAFADYPSLPDTMIFLAVADGFTNNANIPPQARVLQLSKGARFAVCEADETILAQIEIKTTDRKTSKQIHSVVQGMLTLAMLNSGDERLMELTEAIHVDSAESMVTMKMELPVDKAIGTLKRYAH